MKVAVEDISSVKKSLRIEVPQEVVKKEFESAYSDLKKRTKLPGFRQGKVPIDLLEKRFSHEVEHDVVKRLVPDYYQRALKEKGIIPVVLPTIEKVDVKPDAPLSFTATVETKPDIKLSQYEGLPLTRKKIDIQDQAVEDGLKALQDSHGQLVSCDPSHEVQTDEFVLIDFEGQVDGKPFEGGQDKGLLVQVGSHKLISGFEEKLVGRRKGDELQFTIPFPPDYHRQELSGKEAEFHVVVREIKVKNLPDLDDEFAKDVGEYATLEELKKALRKGIEERAKQDMEADLRNQAIQQLIEKHPMESPPSLIEHELSSMLYRLQQQFKQQGQPFDPSDPQWAPVREKYLTLARERIQGRLILQEIAHLEKMEISNQEIEGELTKMAQETKHEIGDIRRYIRSNENAKEDLRTRLLEDKALSFVLSKASYSENPR